MKKNGFRLWPTLLIVVLGGGFIWLMNYGFEHSALVRDIFSGGDSGSVFGEVPANSEASLAARGRLTARISMLIFAVITVMQFVALVIGGTVVSGIRRSDDSAELKLRRLENAEIFFDVPLYVGLFGTVSAFLVMTFSPQSSRLIAYSSTLIGIIFSLVLRLSMQYPLRQKLVRETVESSGDHRK